MKKLTYLLTALYFAVLLGGCGSDNSAKDAGAPQVLNLYGWADYFDPDVISDFEKQNNCKITYDVFSNNEELLAKKGFYANLYESQFVIGEKTINLEVALDEEQVKSVKVKNLDESVETMYPLMKSAVKDVSKQLSAGVSIDEVVLSKNSMYTEKLILDAVKAVLDEQRL